MDTIMSYIKAVHFLSYDSLISIPMLTIHPSPQFAKKFHPLWLHKTTFFFSYAFYISAHLSNNEVKSKIVQLIPLSYKTLFYKIIYSAFFPKNQLQTTNTRDKSIT
jgi:hypothetical protein